MRAWNETKYGPFKLWSWKVNHCVATAQEMDALFDKDSDILTRRYRPCAHCGKDTLVRRRSYLVALSYSDFYDGIVADVDSCSECGTLYEPAREYEVEPAMVRK